MTHNPIYPTIRTGQRIELAETDLIGIQMNVLRVTATSITFQNVKGGREWKFTNQELRDSKAEAAIWYPIP